MRFDECSGEAAKAGVAAVLALASLAAMPVGQAHADQDLELTLQETGKRDYYCRATFQLSGPEDLPFQDINGFFYVFVDDEQVGRSRGASFRFTDGGNTASATFETPNAPCPDVNGYVFVVGACMRGNGFVDRAECAAAIAPAAPVREVKER